MPESNPDDSGPQRRPTRPALKTLQHDQRALLDRDVDLEGPRVVQVPSLRDGMPSRKDVIHWYQAATVRTFGHLSTGWPALDLARDWTLLTALITSANRELWTPDGNEPMTLQEATEYRRMLEHDLVLPACNRAYNQLRKLAGEYIDDEEQEVDTSDLDPQAQEHVAMRPEFQQTDREQRDALERLWSGFKSRDALQEWLHWLDQPTNGAVDPELPDDVLMDDTALHHLLHEGADAVSAQRYRERLAVTVLLPAFNTGLRRMQAGELAKRTRQPSGTWRFD
jgi:hypothetical protein